MKEAIGMKMLMFLRDIWGTSSLSYFLSNGKLMCGFFITSKFKLPETNNCCNNVPNYRTPPKLNIDTKNIQNWCFLKCISFQVWLLWVSMLVFGGVIAFDFFPGWLVHQLLSRAFKPPSCIPSVFGHFFPHEYSVHVHIEWVYYSLSMYTVIHVNITSI